MDIAKLKQTTLQAQAEKAAIAAVRTQWQNDEAEAKHKKDVASWKLEAKQLVKSSEPGIEHAAANGQNYCDVCKAAGGNRADNKAERDEIIIKAFKAKKLNAELCPVNNGKGWRDEGVWIDDFDWWIRVSW